MTILFSGTACAEGTSTVNKIGALKQKIADVKQAVAEEKDKIKAQIASTTANIKNIRQELKTAIEIRIGKRLDVQKLKITNVFESAIQNLKDLNARIESRIAKIEASGIDVSSSKNLLDIAKTKVTLADTELTNLANLLAQDIPAVSTSTEIKAERKTMLQSIKTQSEKTKAAIKTARASIIDVINSMKKGMLKEKNSTSTVQTASTTTSN